MCVCVPSLGPHNPSLHSTVGKNDRGTTFVVSYTGFATPIHTAVEVAALRFVTSVAS
jgi:hypothetical protein